MLDGRVIEARPVNHEENEFASKVIKTGSIVQDKARPEMPTPFLLGLGKRPEVKLAASSDRKSVV